jgi:hypothetical protein
MPADDGDQDRVTVVRPGQPSAGLASHRQNVNPPSFFNHIETESSRHSNQSVLRVTQDDDDDVIWVDDDPIMRTAPLGVLSGAVVGGPRRPLNNVRFWGGRSADKAVVAA